MTKISVEHTWYGCDTGCCGHSVTRTEDDGLEYEKFFFEHPYGRPPEDFARKLVAMAWPDLDDDSYELDFADIVDD